MYKLRESWVHESKENTVGLIISKYQAASMSVNHRHRMSVLATGGRERERVMEGERDEETESVSTTLRHQNGMRHVANAVHSPVQ